jgi:CubicO group peptidase (beta-lactamase class C family)
MDTPGPAASRHSLKNRMIIMRKSLLWTAILLCTAASAPGLAQPDVSVEAQIQDIAGNIAPAVVAKGEVGTPVTLASRMAALHVPGVSVAVIHDGKILWARGFGVTKIGGAPVTSTTLFQAGSISKPVTAMAVMHLVQAGRLKLDADINTYLKSWKVPENQFTAQKKVTLRGLLSHTAGVTVHGFPGYARGAPVPSLVQVLNGEKPANTPAIRVDTVPGTLWRYSGGGYVITQQMLLDVTGQSFPAFLQATVLGPLGMTHSTYEQPLPDARQPDAATPYDQNGVAVEGGAHTYPEMAPAGLWTTPSDLARYAIGVQKALAGQSRVLSKATAALMVKDVGMGHYGLGPGVGGSADRPYFQHGGVDEGFVSDLVAYDHGDGAVIMTNAMGGGRLAEELLRTIARQYHWPDFAPKENEVAKVSSGILDSYAGDYRQGRFQVVALSHSGDHLAVKQGAQDLGGLYPASDHDWFFTDSPARLTFQVGSDGMPTAFIRHANDIDSAAPRISAAQAQAIADELAAKVKNKTQDPATEAAVRRTIEEWRAGKPDYDKMSPMLVNVTRQNLTDLQARVVDFGAVKSIAFKGVTPNGADIYDVAFEKHDMQWRIVLGADGKTESIGLTILP